MIKYFKQAFSITNENIILATPFILFVVLFGIFMGLSNNVLNSIFSAILLLITLLFMVAAFFGGWFYMVQRGIDIHKENINSEEKKSLTIIKNMTMGIGEYFVPFVFGTILFVGLVLLFILAGKIIGNHFIGHINVPFDSFKEAMATNEQLKAFLATIPQSELLKISKWNFLIISLISLFSFFTMFWASAIINTDKNPLFAFFKSVKFIFCNFLNSIILFAYISLINIFISVISKFFIVNNFLYFISTLIYFYFVVYVVVLVFLYYDEQQSEIKPIEIENHCDSGSDSIGQE